MLTAVLLSCALLLALPTTLGAQMGLAPLEGIRRPDQALLPEFPGLGLQALLKKTTAEQSEEALLQKAEALAEMLDPQNRELRSPRRCVRLHESCLGQQGSAYSCECCSLHCCSLHSFTTSMAFGSATFLEVS
uniref:Agouti-related protein n=1 Tax=Spermophilus dauricus TaxID=99837 RepID=A0A8C9Q9H7_SPEDA